MPRKQHNYHYIYKTTCLINENFYIGMHSTSNLEDGYSGSGKRLWYAIQKYGKDNFKTEILEFLPDRISLRAREREIVNVELIKDPKCMNLMRGGEGGFISKDQQRHRSQAGGKATAKRLQEDEEFKRFRSNQASESNKIRHQNGNIKAPDWTGKSHKQETKDKIGESVKISQKGEKNSQFGTCWTKHEEFGIKKVRKEELESFLVLGWKRGRS